MDNENISTNRKISYKMISKEQKLENDKERLKSKFNFNLSRTSTLTTQQNSFIFSDNLKKFKSKITPNINKTNKRPYSTQKIKKKVQKIKFTAVKKFL